MEVERGNSKENCREKPKVALVPGEGGRMKLVGIIQTNQRRVLT